jgi:hypothetical protein
MDHWLATNRDLWDGWTALHRTSPFYDVEGFRAGGVSLKEIDVIAVLIDSGLRIAAFREYPFTPHGAFPYLEEYEPGRWRIRDAEVDMPLTFSLHARREGTP